MVVYIEAHGHESGDGIFIPARQTIHFFAVAQEDALASVTLKAQAEGALPASADDSAAKDDSAKKTTEVKALSSYSDTTIFNYQLSRLESEERGYSEALRKDGLDVRYVGDHSDLPTGMYLCARHGKGECAPDKVKENDGHTCSGLLGKLRPEPEIFMLSCRGAGSHDKNSTHPDLTDYFANVKAQIDYFWTLAESHPDDAWNYIQGLNQHPSGTPENPPSDESVQTAVNNQELLVMMYNENPRIREWIEAYDAIRLWRNESPMAAYIQFRRVSEDAQERWKKYANVGEWINWMVATVNGHVDWLQECVKTPATLQNEWNSLSEIERDQLVAVLRIQGRKDLIATLTQDPTETETPSLESVDWGGVIVDRIVESLRNIREEERAWGYRHGDKLLIESDPQDAVMEWGHPCYDAMKLLDEHYDADAEYTIVCKKQTDGAVTLLMEEGSLDETEFQTAMKRVSGKADFAIRFLTEDQEGVAVEYKDGEIVEHQEG